MVQSVKMLITLLIFLVLQLQIEGIIIEGPGPGPLDILYSRIDAGQLQGPPQNAMYYSGVQPQPQPQLQNGASVNINVNIQDPNKKKQSLDNLLKLGIVLNSIDVGY